MSAPKFTLDQRVRAVRGPGKALQPEPEHVGKIGTIMAVNLHPDMETDYTVQFYRHGKPSLDLIDESCLEAV